jgi:hypothetical protein
MKRLALPLLALAVACACPHRTIACSTILAGPLASADGAVLLSHSCDGDVMGLVYVMPAQSYPEGTRLPMYWNVPRPTTYADYQANLRKEAQWNFRLTHNLARQVRYQEAIQQDPH